MAADLTTLMVDAKALEQVLRNEAGSTNLTRHGSTVDVDMGEWHDVVSVHYDVDGRCVCCGGIRFILGASRGLGKGP